MTLSTIRSSSISVLKWRNKTTSSINNETIGTRGWRQPFSEISAPLKSLRELWYNKWAPDHEACSRFKQETVAGNNLKNVHHKFDKVQSFTVYQNHFIVWKKNLKADFPHDVTAFKQSYLNLSKFLGLFSNFLFLSNLIFSPSHAIMF